MRIIYFDIDSLRPDHLGCYGYDRPTSPTIDSIAQDGVRFDRYYCASSPCVPSRSCLMSGRFGIRNGMLSNHGAGAQFNINAQAYGGPYPDSEMFPRQLKANGYDPVCFSNFADRHYATWFMCGWSEFHSPNMKCGAETAEEVNAKVLPWLQEHATREDYYLHINYWDTHRCYKMDASLAERFDDYPVTQSWPDDDAIAAQQGLTGPFTPHGQFKNDESTYPLMPGSISNRQDFEKLITGYDTSISYVDSHIKEVLDELDRQGVLDEAVIIISSDHGDSFGEHGIYSDHVNVDECIHRIPLIIRWPGLTVPDSCSSAFMYNVDYAPTICDLLDMPLPKEWDGKSYKKNVMSEDDEGREFLVWDSGLYTVQRAVRTKTHLYIRNYDSWEFNNWESEELYDMLDDPYQTRNIAHEHSEIVQKCRGIMDDWVAEQMAKPHGCPQDPLEAVLRERGLKN
ncbi:sulfatase [Rubellicoccus peritrichatus]|uniref:Sulfatase n=1 Tax=Rubellicoccus peritrichatus TaxID=3080537 RepID=A0AAQ3QRN8_9BACT|nr:sulfatase [Puniceicoccus sp. CR14]WOO41483.1 sulfatase [Puniceicoccus sp. CR14]